VENVRLWKTRWTNDDHTAPSHYREIMIDVTFS